MKAFRNLRLIGIALAALALLGVVGFHLIEGWSWFDGFYVVVTTFTTIGYQEVHGSPTRAAYSMWALFL